jgi:microcystin-dependent protein
MPDPFLGEIRMFAGNFAPQGWAFCAGQILAIASNQALFALLGDVYGGDGKTTFSLPDLRGRAPVGVGGGGNTGPGLSSIPLGQKSGAESVSLSYSQLPNHTHQATFSGATSAVKVSADVATSSANAMVPPTSGNTTYLSATTAKAGLAAVAFNGLFTATIPDSSKANLGGISGGTTAAGSVTVSAAGGSQAVPIRNPYLGINFIIATVGIFPSRP